MHTTHDTDLDLAGALVDAYASAGLDPADDANLTWIGERYDAARATGNGWVVARHNANDEDLYLALLTNFGVIRTETRFGLDDLDLAMFVVSAGALIQADRTA